MDGSAVPKRDDSEPSAQRKNIGPVPDSTIGLNLLVGRGAENGFDPLTPEVGALAQYLLLEIARGLHPPTLRQGCSWPVPNDGSAVPKSADLVTPADDRGISWGSERRVPRATACSRRRGAAQDWWDRRA